MSFIPCSISWPMLQLISQSAPDPVILCRLQIKSQSLILYLFCVSGPYAISVPVSSPGPSQPPLWTCVPSILSLPDHGCDRGHNLIDQLTTPLDLSLCMFLKFSLGYYPVPFWSYISAVTTVVDWDCNYVIIFNMRSGLYFSPRPQTKQHNELTQFWQSWSSRS